MSNNNGGPGTKGWKWFPNARDDWSLDVVTLLAVIGESSMAEHSQSITASLLCLLPRIIPAPQALLKPSRPSRMPETHARMTGVYSGTTLDTVGFFANIITPLDAEPAFSFKVLDIRHAGAVQDAELNPPPADDRRWRWRSMSWGSSAAGSAPPGSKRVARDEENGVEMAHPPQRQPTVHFQDGASPRDATASGADTAFAPKPLQRQPTNRQKWQDRLANPARTMAVTGERPAVPPRLFSPMHILSVFSFVLSIAIIVAAVFWEDGVAILAVTLISAASSVVGYASFWSPILMRRQHNNKVPQGDVMIRTREGAFILIRCTEDVARELYSGTEECKYYVGERAYRLLMALGTTLLMLSVVLFGNCTWNSQIFIGGSYIVLNGLYWALGMIPRRYSWDLSRYEWKDDTPEDAKNADKITDASDQREGHPSYTRTLWLAIRETKRIGWVERSGAAPGTEQWKRWLREAEVNARENKPWNAVGRKDDIFRDDEAADSAAQHAPATEVMRGPVGPHPHNVSF